MPFFAGMAASEAVLRVLDPHAGPACRVRVRLARGVCPSLLERPVLQTLSFRVAIMLFGLVLNERGAVGVRILPKTNAWLLVCPAVARPKASVDGDVSGGAPKDVGRRSQWRCAWRRCVRRRCVWVRCAWACRLNVVSGHAGRAPHPPSSLRMRGSYDLR